MIGRTSTDKRQIHQNNFQQKCQMKIRRTIACRSGLFFIKSSGMNIEPHRAEIEKAFRFKLNYWNGGHIP
jgi:hypothetical protein